MQLESLAPHTLISIHMCAYCVGKAVGVFLSCWILGACRVGGIKMCGNEIYRKMRFLRASYKIIHELDLYICVSE